MINNERSRAFKGIAEEQVPQAPQPMQGISSAFLHTYLACMTEEIQKDYKQLEESFQKAGVIQFFDTKEVYNRIPHRYC